MLAVLAPGQGSQSPGFLTPWLADEAFARRLTWASAVVGRDLAWLGTAGSDEEIRDTAICQPLLVAVGLAAGRLVVEPDTGAWYAGHSVGELTAAVLAGAFSDETALVLARERGAAMAAAAAATPTGMSAVLGGPAEKVADLVAGAGLVLANHNGAGQVVAAGPLDRLAELPALLDGVATRVTPLRVAGAFHTPYMAPARDRLAALAPALPARDPHAHLLSNADGAVVRAGADLVARLVRQVAQPVRWDACMQTLADAGVTGVVELPPAGTLAGLVRRELREVEVVALRTPEDLPAARRLVVEHATPGPAPEPAWRVVVAPAAGVFEPEPVDAVAPGAKVGTVRGRRDDAPVLAPYGGVLVEWLALAGDPVKPGQPLARLHPQAGTE